MHLPHAVGYEHGPAIWWPLPVLADRRADRNAAGDRRSLPGDGGHIPARGLSAGVVRAGPERRPGRAVLAATRHDRLRTRARARGAPHRAGCGPRWGVHQPRSPRHAFASPDVGHGDRELRRDVVRLRFPGDRRGDPDRSHRDRWQSGNGCCSSPGCWQPGSGRSCRSGSGLCHGLSSSDYALGALPLPTLDRLEAAQFAWTIAFAIAIASRDHAGDAWRAADLPHRLTPGALCSCLSPHSSSAVSRSPSLRSPDKSVERGPVLRPGSASRAHQPGRHLVAGLTRAGSSSSRASPTRCRSAASAAAPPSPHCSWAPPRGSWHRISRASRCRQPCRSGSRQRSPSVLQPATVGGRGCDVADVARRQPRGAADHPGRRRRLRHDARARTFTGT